VGKKRILIVDDAVVVRRMLSDMLDQDEELEVVGTAANGKIALEKIPQVNPDILILDLDMPEMDGLETLKQLRKIDRHLPVIVFSTRTERGAKVTLEALSLGATDYVTKPSSLSGGMSAIDAIRGQLVPKVKGLRKRRRPEAKAPKPSTPVAPPSLTKPTAKVVPKMAPLPPPARRSRVRLLAIGSSTGGPNALTELLRAIPAPLPVPILIVQHMPPIFTRILAERLSVNTKHKAFECTSGTVIEPGKIWIAPGGFHMVVTKAPSGPRMQTHQGEPENSCRPAVDVLLRSVADVYGSSALTAILTGMGSDGLKGCRRIREVGGQVLAQDEESSVVWGMPGYVAKEGLAEKVLPIGALAAEICSRIPRG